MKEFMTKGEENSKGKNNFLSRSGSIQGIVYVI
jgi:hypothetical protein